MRSWFFPDRGTEATPQALAATGAAGTFGVDPIDGDSGYTPLGQQMHREQPRWTTERARAYSVAAYRSNPMARAIIDTYTSFVCGDAGIAPQCDDPAVLQVVNEFWVDPRNQWSQQQVLFCRDWMLAGEFAGEYMVGELTGRVRWSPITSARIEGVTLDRGNPLWHKEIVLTSHGAEPTRLQIAQIDDLTELRTGQCFFVPSWRALTTDRRGTPFLQPVLDDLDSYAQVLSNLVDRTALARYVAFDVTIDGDDEDVTKFIRNRGGQHVPRSGSIEVHNKSVEWDKLEVSSGSFEDTNTSLSILTNVAGGAGLAKTWLAESEGANRATSQSMAEPVRRRIGGVQSDWLAIMAEQCRFAVDRAVAAGRLPRLVASRDAAGSEIFVPPSTLVRVTGPEVAPSTAEMASTVMLNLSTAIANAIDGGFMTKDAGAVAIQKGWEQLVGRPFPPSLMPKSTVTLSADATAEEISAAQREGRLFLLN